MKDMVGLNDGKGTVLVNVHTIEACAGQLCCIHNPSDHHMRLWKPEWNPVFKMMMRMCAHGTIHPDPDDIAHLRRHWGPNTAALMAHHLCDGCCQPYGFSKKKLAIEPEPPQPQLVDHEPIWRPADLRIDAAGNTRPGFICIHELENGSGQCGGNVFRIEDAVGKHSCWVGP